MACWRAIGAKGVTAELKIIAEKTGEDQIARDLLSAKLLQEFEAEKDPLVLDDVLAEMAEVRAWVELDLVPQERVDQLIDALVARVYSKPQSGPPHSTGRTMATSRHTPIVASPAESVSRAVNKWEKFAWHEHKVSCRLLCLRCWLLPASC